MNQNILNWSAIVLTFLGLLLLSYKIMWCWPLYILANILWIAYLLPKKERALAFMNMCYLVLNTFAWYKWTR